MTPIKVAARIIKGNRALAFRVILLLRFIFAGALAKFDLAYTV
jgi:hypothetical protein